MAEKMTYQERIDITCDQMAYEQGNAVRWNKDTIRAFYSNRAKWRIEAQAEAVRAFVAQHDPYTDTYFCEKFLLEHGYIDPKTRDDDSKA